MDTSRTMGSFLREIRKSRKETIEQVAKATKASPASFTLWENDEVMPSANSLKKLSAYYGKDLNELKRMTITSQPTKSKDGLDSEETKHNDKRVISVEELLDNKTELTLGGEAIPNEVVMLTKTFFNGASAMYELMSTDHQDVDSLL